MSAQNLPADLQDVLDQIDAADRDGAALASGLSDAQFHWQPDRGKAWSIAQCLDHLGTMNRVYGTAIAAGMEQARARGWTRRGPIQPGLAGRWFISSMEPPVKRRLRSPSITRPAPSRSRDEIMRTYHDAHEQIRRLIVSCANLDVNRARFVNPFVRWIRWRVGAGLCIIAAHDRRHLWQAARVKERPQFPR